MTRPIYISFQGEIELQLGGDEHLLTSEGLTSYNAQSTALV